MYSTYCGKSAKICLYLFAIANKIEVSNSVISSVKILYTSDGENTDDANTFHIFKCQLLPREDA